MDQLQLYIPITKIDEEKRLVYGVATAEFPDKAGEICDYESTKKNYLSWSDSFAKATDGQSLGNLRAMHTKHVAGKVVSIHPNDNLKQIEVCAKVVDDNDWRKCLEGAYTGFSHGGSYEKRWKDDVSGLWKYTALVSELSLVDDPCLPMARFQCIKSDGSVEMRKFAHEEEISDDDFGDLVKIAADTMSVARHGTSDRWDDYFLEAGQFLIKAYSADQPRDEQGRWASVKSSVVNTAARVGEAVRTGLPVAAGAAGGAIGDAVATFATTGLSRGSILTSASAGAAVAGMIQTSDSFSDAEKSLLQHFNRGLKTGGLVGAVVGQVREARRESGDSSDDDGQSLYDAIKEGLTDVVSTFMSDHADEIINGGKTPEKYTDALEAQRARHKSNVEAKERRSKFTVLDGGKADKLYHDILELTKLNMQLAEDVEAVARLASYRDHQTTGEYIDYLSEACWALGKSYQAMSLLKYDDDQPRDENGRWSKAGQVARAAAAGLVAGAVTGAGSGAFGGGRVGAILGAIGGGVAGAGAAGFQQYHDDEDISLKQSALTGGGMGITAGGFIGEHGESGIGSAKRIAERLFGASRQLADAASETPAENYQSESRREAESKSARDSEYQRQAEFQSWLKGEKTKARESEKTKKWDKAAERKFPKMKAKKLSSEGDMTKKTLTNDEVVARAVVLAKAAGKTEGDFIEFLDAARDALQKDAPPPPPPVPAESSSKSKGDADGDEGKEKKADGDGDGDEGKEKSEVKKIADVRQVWLADDGKTFEKKADAVLHNEKLAKGVDPIDKILDSITSALSPEKPAVVQKSAWDLAGEEISSLARQDTVDLSAILGKVLALATGDDKALLQKLTDQQSSMQKSAPSEDLEKITAERDDLQKRADKLVDALEKAVPALTDMKKRLDDQAAEIEKLKSTPVPPPALRVVDKGSDGVQIHNGEDLLKEASDYISKLPPQDKQLAMIKISQMTPVRVNL